MQHKKKALITGISGQDGAYLAKLLLSKGYSVVGLTRQLAPSALSGLHYLGIADRVHVTECDLLDFSAVQNTLNKHKPSEIYNLAAQSSVAASFKEPLTTIQFNVLSVSNLLQAVFQGCPDAKFYQASSSEIFGRVTQLPVSEQTLIHPVSPYAISKAAAHWSVVNYREAYGLFACAGILFNHESYLRPSSFFVKKVISESLSIKAGTQTHLRVGNIDVRRDFGYAPDYVEAMWLMLQQETPSDILVCSGVSISLRQIIEHVFARLGISNDRIMVDPELYRPAEIIDLYGDPKNAKIKLKWAYERSFFDVLDLLKEKQKSER
ncbi:MAG: GDP-mannose 4,6-dehydratase [Proteobacteria bacterium]|nr:GDP-mannose 4,6-dehydratase [Pseudomonadota bacterium]